VNEWIYHEGEVKQSGENDGTALGESSEKGKSHHNLLIGGSGKGDGYVISQVKSQRGEKQIIFLTVCARRRRGSGHREGNNKSQKISDRWEFVLTVTCGWTVRFMR